jgi:hypothetical protein
MDRSKEEVAADINATLDQLIDNASAIQSMKHGCSSCEIEALEKIQESLLARLIHMNESAEGASTRPVQKKELKGFGLEHASRHRKKSGISKLRFPKTQAAFHNN